MRVELHFELNVRRHVELCRVELRCAEPHSVLLVKLRGELHVELRGELCCVELSKLHVELFVETRDELHRVELSKLLAELGGERRSVAELGGKRCCVGLCARPRRGCVPSCVSRCAAS